MSVPGGGRLSSSIAAALFCWAIAVPQGAAKADDSKMPLPGIWLDEHSFAARPRGLEWRSIGPKGLELTKSSEGFRSHLYADPAGYCTIGFGHLVKRAPCSGDEPDHFRDGLSQLEGTQLLRSDMRHAEFAVMTMLELDLTEPQYDALCDFVFNVGGAKFKGSTLLAVLKAGEFQRVPGQLRRWVLANGKELPGLVTRREREIALFLEGTPVLRGPLYPDEDLSPIDIMVGEVTAARSSTSTGSASGTKGP